MPLKKNQVKETEKMVIEDYNGQKSLWDGKEESSKVTLDIRSAQIELSISTRNFLHKFTACNYLMACNVLKLSPSKRYVSVALDSSLETVFQETQMKTVRLYVKYDRNPDPRFCPDIDLRISFSKDISLNIKDKDRKAILWNGKQFVNKMKFNLTDQDVMSQTLESLLAPHAALSYLRKNCSAKLLSPKYENILTPVSMKEIVASFILDSSATIYLQNTGATTGREKEEMKNMDLDFELVPLPSCSSIEMIDMEEINGISKKSIPTDSAPDNSKAWVKSDWKAIRSLIMQLEGDALTTMGYRYVSEEDRKELITELWALNKAFKKSKTDVNEVRCHFKALEKVVTNNRPGAMNVKSKESYKSKQNIQSCFFEDENYTKKGRYSNRPLFMKNSMKKHRRFGKVMEKPEESSLNTTEPQPPFDYAKNKATRISKMPALTCPDCLSDLICQKCRQKNMLSLGSQALDCWNKEEPDQIGFVYMAVALSTFFLVLVLIYFI